MKEFIEKLIGRLSKNNIFRITTNSEGKNVFEIIEELAEEYKHCALCYLQHPCEYQNENIELPLSEWADSNGWIPCSERLPKVETMVYIVAKRKYSDGSFKYITTTAMYEDGTVLENDSCWIWEDIEGEWDEENDCYIIPEGWWEDKKYNADGELNHAVDDVVIAWQPLPEPYKERDKKG